MIVTGVDVCKECDQRNLKYFFLFRKRDCGNVIGIWKVLKSY